MRRTRAFGALIIGGALVLGSWPATVDAEQPELYFVDDDTDLQLTSPTTTLTLVSNADVDLEVTLTLVLRELPSAIAGAPPVTAADVVRLPDRISVPAHQRIDFEIAVVGVDGLELGDDGVRGEVAASTTAPVELWATRPIVLTAPDAPSGSATPAVAKWTVAYTNGKITEGSELPLAKPGTVPTPRIGVLQSTSGDTVTVSAAQSADGDGADLQVAGGIHRGTTYTGTVDFDPDADGGEVELTLRSTDQIGWAALAILGGILAGLGTKWLLGVYWPRRRLKGDVTKCFVEAERQQGEFDNTARNAVPRYTITPSATKAHERALEAVGNVGLATFSIDTASKDYLATDKELGRLGHAADWGEPAARALVDLKAALAALTRLPVQKRPAKPPGANASPAVRTAATKRLAAQGSDLELDLDNVSAFVEETKWLTDSLENFKARVAALNGRRVVLDKIERHTQLDDELQLVQEARRQLAGARWVHWQASTKAALEAGRFDARVASVDDTIASLSGRLAQTSKPAVVARRTSAASLVQESIAGVPLSLFGPIGTVVTKVGHALRGRGSSVFSRLSGGAAIAVVIVTIVSGIFTGLETLYTEEAFGSFRDYAGAIGWGLAASATIQAVVEVGGALAGPRKPATAAADSKDAE